MSGKDVIVTPNNPLVITDQGPFDYNKVEIEGGLIKIKTDADVKLKDLIKKS